MKAPPIPDEESERLAGLYALNILDSPPEERFDRITDLASALFDVPIAYITLVDENRQWFKSCLGMEGGETSREVSFCGHAILGDEALIIPDARQDDRFHDNPLVVGKPHVRFYAGQPLRCPQGYKVGTLCLVDRSPRGLVESEITHLKSLARITERELASSEIARLHSQISELRDKEKEYVDAVRRSMELGRRIQTQFLPRSMPDIEGWTLGSEFRPAMEVAGDFYDFISLSDGRFVAVIGDIAGKGVGAAIFMALVRTLLRSNAERMARSDSDVLTAVLRVNDYIARHHRSGSHMFASLFFSVVTPDTGDLAYINAGHCPPIIRRASGTLERLAPTGPAVGLMAGAGFRTEHITLEKGDLLLGFTDGVDEAHDEEGGMFGDERVVDQVNSHGGDADTVVHELDSAVKQFMGDAPVHDDVTIIAISRNG